MPSHLDAHAILASPMDTATAEPPAQTQDKPRTFPKPLPFDREAIKMASIAGIEDADLAAQYPGLTRNTLRKWRERDPAWSAAFYATRQGRHKGNPPRIVREAREAQTQALTPPTTQGIAPTGKPNPENLSPLVTHDLIAEGIPAAMAQSRLLAAYEVKRALLKRTKEKKPLPITNFAELGQAMRVAIYAEGRDAEAPAIQLNVWGNPGLQAQQQTGGFRDLPANGTETNGDAS